MMRELHTNWCCIYCSPSTAAIRVQLILYWPVSAYNMHTRQIIRNLCSTMTYEVANVSTTIILHLHTWQYVHLHEVVSRWTVPHLPLQVISNLTQKEKKFVNWHYHLLSSWFTDTHWRVRTTSSAFHTRAPPSFPSWYKYSKCRLHPSSRDAACRQPSMLWVFHRLCINSQYMSDRKLSPSWELCELCLNGRVKKVCSLHSKT